MVAPFCDFVLVNSDYGFLLELVRDGWLRVSNSTDLRWVSARTLEKKGLAEIRDGVLRPTALGLIASRTRRTSVDGLAFLLKAEDLAEAAAGAQPQEDAGSLPSQPT